MHFGIYLFFSECGIAEAAFVATVEPLCTRWVYERASER